MQHSSVNFIHLDLALGEIPRFSLFPTANFSLKVTLTKPEVCCSRLNDALLCASSEEDGGHPVDVVHHCLFVCAPLVVLVDRDPVGFPHAVGLKQDLVRAPCRHGVLVGCRDYSYSGHTTTPLQKVVPHA